MEQERELSPQEEKDVKHCTRALREKIFDAKADWRTSLTPNFVHCGPASWVRGVVGPWKPCCPLDGLSCQIW